MNDLLNIMRREAQRVMSQVSHKRVGIVLSYDPDHYAVTVEIQPEGRVTGWIPLKAAQIGNLWGDYAPPSIGDIIEVDFQEGDKESGIAGDRFFSATIQPLACPSGERWIVHKSGSFIKLHNDGSVEISANGNMTLTSGGTLRMTAQTIQVHATAEYRFDVNGHGQAWLPTKIDTYQTGEVTGATNAISPPEIGD